MTLATVRTALVKRWRADFDPIRGDVVDLLEQRELYREIRKILEADAQRFAKMDGTIFVWLAKMHAHSAVIAIRKQLDPRQDSVSLRGLLTSIAPVAEVLTRAAFVARAGRRRAREDERSRLMRDELRRWHEEKFDELTAAGARALTEAMVRRDLDRLDAAARRVKRFANNEIAHRGRPQKGLKVQATWQELNRAIDTIEALVTKYNALLGFPHPPTLLASRVYDWRAPLRVPWLLDDRARKLAREMLKDASAS